MRSVDRSLKSATQTAQHDYDKYGGRMTKYLPLFFQSLRTENDYLAEIASNFIKGIADPMLKQMTISEYNDLKAQSDADIQNNGADRFVAELNCLRKLILFPATHCRANKQCMQADPQESANIRAAAAAAFGNDNPLST